jgi:hypothetical protein
MNINRLITYIEIDVPCAEESIGDIENFPLFLSPV